MAKLYYSPFIPQFSGNGLPVAGAKLYFFLSGTNTPTPVYSNEALTIPLSNPVVSDGAGRYPNIYLNEAVTYRVRATDRNDAPLGADIDPYIPGEALRGPAGPPGNPNNPGLGYLVPVDVGVMVNQAPMINSVLSQPDVNEAVLPAGVIWINQSVVVPANKQLTLQPGTILRAMSTFTNVAGNNSGIVLAGDRAIAVGGTVDMNKVGLGGDPNNRKNGVTVNNGCQDCIRRDMVVMNCSGYAVWDGGANNLLNMPNSYNENIRTFNSQVHFEPQGANGTVYFNCHSRDGDADIPCASYFHPLVGSKNIKFIACTAYGNASAGVDLNSNIDVLREIHFIDCDVETTGFVTALAHPSGFLGCKDLRIIGGRYKSAGIGVSLVDTTATLVNVRIEGGNGMESTNSELDCTGCEAIGTKDVGGGASSFGVIAFGTGMVRYNAGSLTAVGPVGSMPGAGQIRISSDTKQTPAQAGPPVLTKRQEYAAQLTATTDGVNCYANFAVPLNPADLTKITCKVGVRSLTGGYVDYYGASWRYNGSGNVFRAQIGNRVLNSTNHVIDVHFIEFA